MQKGTHQSERLTQGNGATSVLRGLCLAGLWWLAEELQAFDSPGGARPGPSPWTAQHEAAHQSALPPGRQVGPPPPPRVTGPTRRCSSLCQQSSQCRLEKTHCRTSTLAQEKGVPPSSEEPPMAAVAPTGCGRSSCGSRLRSGHHWLSGSRLPSKLQPQPHPTPPPLQPGPASVSQPLPCRDPNNPIKTQQDPEGPLPIPLPPSPGHIYSTALQHPRGVCHATKYSYQRG